MTEPTLTMLDAAYRVLSRGRDPMRPADIWQAMASDGLYTSAGETPAATLAAEMLRASLGQRVSRPRQEKPFYKAGEGTFGLVEWLSEVKREELAQRDAVRGTAGRTNALGVDSVRYDAALQLLRDRYRAARNDPEFQSIMSARSEVVQRFQPMFDADAVGSIAADAFRSFLIFKNNRHWKGLQRLGPAVTADMPALRQALQQLRDESKPIADRMDYANDRVPRLAQAVLTPILLVASGAQDYGVWNRVSEEGLTRLGIMPAADANATLGARYARINEILRALAKELEIDLWALDALWWVTDAKDRTTVLPDPPPNGHVWVEITRETPHGGRGWELGKCLWSPARTTDGSDRYASMREVQPGDVVVHFVEPSGGGDRLVLGWSRIAARYREVTTAPPEPETWSGRDKYFRVDLERFVRATTRLTVKQLQARAEPTIRADMETVDGFPFTKYGDGLRLATGVYLARCTPKLYEQIRSALGGEIEQEMAELSDVCTAFASALRATGITFGDDHDRLARRFLCSLAAKRFVILTGLSGSGKTQLALKLGEWLGTGRHEVIPVRPDWTGPEPLLGYEDALLPAEGDARAWCVPRALELMLRAARDPGNAYLLVLDEMNLAHIERYFADVLSGIESNEPILPDLHLSGGYWRARDRAKRLPLPDNLFIVGTVNVDETTYTFSPKVLDRANTIEFRVPTNALSQSPKDAQRPEKCRPGATEHVAAFLEIARNSHDASPEVVSTVAAELRRLHALLCATHDEFGHRTFFEGVRLVSLLHDAGDETANRLLDVFVLQKVLPRMHGARRRLEPVLRVLAGFCRVGTSDTADALDDVFDAAPAEVRLPDSFGKVQRIWHALRANQFASFAD